MSQGGQELDILAGQYGEALAKKLGEVAISGEPEEQLRSPLEALVAGIAALVGRDSTKLSIVGETSLSDLQTRPDFAVSYQGTLVGFIEVKAPGKGADPRKFKNPHDREQWKKLQALPNLVYTDGQEFSLWRDGELGGKILSLTGDITTAGKSLLAPEKLLGLFDDFLQWHPIAPKRPKQLAEMTARLCRLLRDEVAEQLAAGSPSLTNLAEDWRGLLFPTATDEEFADGYAQSVTFGLLLARAKGIALDGGIGDAAKDLQHTYSLMGTALRIVTQATEDDQTLTTSVAVMRRVLSVVDWPTVSKGESAAWLYFYEDFLAAYDPALRKQTGSYYTPVEVVDVMTRLSEEALVERFGLKRGFADPSVTVLDPAMGTGTFLLSVLQRIANRAKEELGPGGVSGELADALKRLFAFEIQLGPYSVAQLRILAELAEADLVVQADSLSLYVTNSLANPWVEETHLGGIYEPISDSRRHANEVKRDKPIQVVIGNPPYKVASKGEGGWVEVGDTSGHPAPFLDFIPPSSWGVGAHVKHLYNPYVYFWRWGTWKVFDHHAPDHDTGIVCFITVSGFLNGPGFQKMRAYLRQTSDAIYVIDCSPEGHQPAVNTRIFEGVQHPVCITLVVRDGSKSVGEFAEVKYLQLDAGNRKDKFTQLAGVSLATNTWESCGVGERDPFLPGGEAEWISYPSLDDLLRWSGSGIMPGRTWIVDPDAETLRERWHALINAPDSEKAALFMEHPTDRRVDQAQSSNLPGFSDERSGVPILKEAEPCPDPIQIGYRSFDRQYIIPDKRVINRPNPTLWEIRSNHQVFLTALHRTSPKSGPGVTFSDLIPDLDYYHGRGGRAYPLWLDETATIGNVVPDVLGAWGQSIDREINTPDLFAYIAALLAHPGYTATFHEQLRQPGLRIPLTLQGGVFNKAVDIGRRVLWLHTYGERFVDPTAGRPGSAPRMEDPPKLEVPIPDDEAQMPEELTYDATTGTLRVGSGEVSGVTPTMRQYEVSGVNVLDKWFSYRKKERARPVIGDKKRSELEKIHARKWQHHYSVELLDLLNILGLLIDLEPAQDELLSQVLAGSTLSMDDLEVAGALPVDPPLRKVPQASESKGPQLPL